jgi:hypothetical protein
MWVVKEKGEMKRESRRVKQDDDPLDETLQVIETAA